MSEASEPRSVCVSGSKHDYCCCRGLTQESAGTDLLLEPPVDIRGTSLWFSITHTNNSKVSEDPGVFEVTDSSVQIISCFRL